MTEFKISTVSADSIQRVSTSKSSKYDDLREACLLLQVDQAIPLDCPEGEDQESFRTNISNAVRVRTNAAFKAKGLDQKVRIVRTADGGVAIVCYKPAPPKEKAEKAEGEPRRAVPKRPVKMTAKS